MQGKRLLATALSGSTRLALTVCGSAHYSAANTFWKILVDGCNKDGTSNCAHSVACRQLSILDRSSPSCLACLTKLSKCHCSRPALSTSASGVGRSPAMSCASLPPGSCTTGSTDEWALRLDNPRDSTKAAWLPPPSGYGTGAFTVAD